MRLSGHFAVLATTALFVHAVPAEAAQRCGPLKIFASVEMTLDGSGRPLIPAVINGRQTPMLLDTGGVISTLTQKAFEDSGRNALRRSDIVLYDVLGNRMDRTVTLPTLTIGQVRGSSWRFWIHAPEFDLGNTQTARSPVRSRPIS
jgi:aspartyl protease